jgi:hypothetical protein
MQEISRQLRELILAVRPRLDALPENLASDKPCAQKWSRKEILGHLIDSASNNHQRFVRMQELRHLGTFRYSQEHWVSSQHYQQEPWSDLIDLWYAYNSHLAHVISGIHPDSLTATCDVGGPLPLTLEQVVRDYVRHVEHHIDQILGSDDPMHRKPWNPEG